MPIQYLYSFNQPISLNRHPTPPHTPIIPPPTSSPFPPSHTSPTNIISTYPLVPKTWPSTMCYHNRFSLYTGSTHHPGSSWDWSSMFHRLGTFDDYCETPTAPHFSSIHIFKTNKDFFFVLFLWFWHQMMMDSSPFVFSFYNGTYWGLNKMVETMQGIMKFEIRKLRSSYYSLALSHRYMKAVHTTSLTYETCSHCIIHLHK